MYVMTQNERLFINIKHFECISIDNVDDSCYTIAGHYHNDNQEAVEFGVYGDFKGAPVPFCSGCLAPSRIIRPCSICRIVLSNTMIKTCINCGRGFQPTAKKQIFCSTTCRTNFHNKRRCQKAIKEDKSIVPTFSDFGFSNRANSHSCFNCGKYVETPYKLCDKCRNAFVDIFLNLPVTWH